MGFCVAVGFTGRGVGGSGVGDAGWDSVGVIKFREVWATASFAWRVFSLGGSVGVAARFTSDVVGTQPSSRNRQAAETTTMGKQIGIARVLFLTSFHRREDAGIGLC